MLSFEILNFYQQYFYLSITGFMEVNPLLKTKYSNSESNIRKTLNYTSPQIENYHQIAHNYQKYIEDLSPRIQTIRQKQNYRTYLKQQKLNNIHTQLNQRKLELQQQLLLKQDPTKSPNGLLYTEIKHLTKLQQTYSRIKDSLQTKMTQKLEEYQKVQKIVHQQTHLLKSQLRQSFASCYLNQKLALPKISRNMSDSAFITRQRTDSHLSPSRESVMSKLNQTTEQRIAQKLNQEQQKLILLKLFAIYARHQLNQGQPHLSIRTIQQLEKDIEAKTKLIQEVKVIMRNQ